MFFPRSSVGDLPTIVVGRARWNAGRYGDWLLIAPPLVIDEPTCDELIDGLETTLTAATPEVLDSTSPPEALASPVGQNGPYRAVSRPSADHE